MTKEEMIAKYPVWFIYMVGLTAVIVKFVIKTIHRASA